MCFSMSWTSSSSANLNVAITCATSPFDTRVALLRTIGVSCSGSPSSDLLRSRIEGRRTLSNVAAKVESFGRTAVRPALGGLAQRVDLRHLDESGNGRKFYCMLASYAGHLKHGAAMGAWEELWAKHRWLEALLKRREWSFAARWSRRGLVRAQSFHAQYWRLASRAGDDSLVFFQVGRFIEFYGPQRFLAVRTLGLHSAALPRAGYAFTAGFPTHLSGLYASRAIKKGLIVLEVRQVSAPIHQGYPPRVPGSVLMPNGGTESRRMG